ncbi:MAG: hypothetical protein L3J23_01360 [Flavobacteriaceae bacterium]|nr:hypothetical protein [Flavobacteriaceae bacterium]
MTKKADTISFIVRFHQKIYKEENESKIQWRGKIIHVQGEDKQHFSDFNDALIFMRKKLAKLTEDATKDQSKEEQEGILDKSLHVWNTLKEMGPKVIKEAIKNPKKQISQIQEQLSFIGDEIGEKVQLDQWRSASKSDLKEIKNVISQLAEEIKKLNTKVTTLSKKK